jgi:hypothetical protein
MDGQRLRPHQENSLLERLVLADTGCRSRQVI